jgi:hypothetical protein
MAANCGMEKVGGAAVAAGCGRAEKEKEGAVPL